jgi:hypothetical protein
LKTASDVSAARRSTPSERSAFASINPTQKEISMRKSGTTATPTAPIKFGALTPEAVERIDHNDAAHSASSAHYKFETRMRALQLQYESKAAEIRREYLAEIGALNGSSEAE